MSPQRERLKRGAMASVVVVSGGLLALAGFLGYQTDAVQLAVAQLMLFCGAF